MEIRKNDIDIPWSNNDKKGRVLRVNWGAFPGFVLREGWWRWVGAPWVPVVQKHCGDHLEVASGCLNSKPTMQSHLSSHQLAYNLHQPAMLKKIIAQGCRKNDAHPSRSALCAVDVASQLMRGTVEDGEDGLLWFSMLFRLRTSARFNWHCWSSESCPASPRKKG